MRGKELSDTARGRQCSPLGRPRGKEKRRRCAIAPGRRSLLPPEEAGIGHPPRTAGEPAHLELCPGRGDELFFGTEAGGGEQARGAGPAERRRRRCYPSHPHTLTLRPPRPRRSPRPPFIAPRTMTSAGKAGPACGRGVLDDPGGQANGGTPCEQCAAQRSIHDQGADDNNQGTRSKEARGEGSDRGSGVWRGGTKPALPAGKSWGGSKTGVADGREAQQPI